MLRTLLNAASPLFLQPHLDHMLGQADAPDVKQLHTFRHLISTAKDTWFGRQHGFGSIRNYHDFQNRVPIQPYEAFYPLIERVLQGEADVLWPGKVKWFAKSSGTTNAKSKFIPITQESLNATHFAAGKAMLAVHLYNRPDSVGFTGKALSIGGAHEISQFNEHARYGDLSAVLIQNIPTFFEFFRTPSRQVALMDEWEAKIDAMARETAKENVTVIVGVPTWTVVLIERIFELYGPCPGGLHDIWPNLELFSHGAVSFKPYREQFERLIPNPGMMYLENYNASEGYFGLQVEPDRRDMWLMVDYGIFYEFIPLDELHREQPRALTLDQIELDTPYAMVISTNGGLWRYMIGDTVRFTSREPYRLVITGRTKHFINAFGEELVIENADTALAHASHHTGATINDYTAAPIYFNEQADGSSKGGHEWVIEFATPPSDLAHFTALLDEKLQEINTDYAAKRYKNMALHPPRVHVAPPGTFYQWLAARGKLGGQNKVPRLANDRTHLDAILQLLE